MNRKEYLEKVSAGINDDKVKHALEQELDDHICSNEKYWLEIGYDGEEAELKALNAMGDAEPVAEQLGRVHNHNNIRIGRDILFFLIAILSGLVYMITIDMSAEYSNSNYLNLYRFAVSASSGAMLCLCSAISIKAKSSGYAVITLIVSAIGIYLSVCVCGIVTVLTAVLLLLVIACCFFTIKYNRKTARLKNTKKDLKIKKGLTVLTFAIAAVLTAASALFFGSLVQQSYENAERYRNEILPYVVEYAEDETVRNDITTEKSPFKGLFDENVSGFEAYTDDGCAMISTSRDEYYYYLQADAKLYYIDFNYYFLFNSITAKKEIIDSADKICNKEHFANQNNREIVEYFLSQNPCSVTVHIWEDQTRWDFSYRRRTNMSFDQIVWVTFDAEGNLKEITHT